MIGWPWQYYFGIYHWQRRARRIGIGGTIFVAGLGLGTELATPPAYAGGLLLAFVGLWYAQPAVKRVLAPPPWLPDSWKYRPLRAALPMEEADRWLDVGSGTGRSLVGLGGERSEHWPERSSSPRVTALDVFDSRVILGNGARLAERNAGAAGLGVDPVRGDGCRLPVRTGSHDLVTACRLLHDVDRSDAELILREMRRVVRKGGRVGILEIPKPHAPVDDPLGYWEALLEANEFEVEVSGSVKRSGSAYYYLVGIPV